MAKQLGGIKQRKPTYDAGHKPILEVPRGGSSCATCRYVSKDLEHCANKHFIAFHGTSKLPYPADEMCSDWWEWQRK